MPEKSQKVMEKITSGQELADEDLKDVEITGDMLNAAGFPDEIPAAEEAEETTPTGEGPEKEEEEKEADAEAAPDDKGEIPPVVEDADVTPAEKLTDDTEGLPAEPSDAEKSKLGRRVKEQGEIIHSQNEKIDTLSDTVENLVTKITSLLEKERTAPGEDDYSFLDSPDGSDQRGEDDIVTSKEDVLRIMNEKEEQKKAAQTEADKKEKAYYATYISEMNDMDDKDPFEQRVIQLMVKEGDASFRQRVTGDPKLDFQFNRNAAAAALAKGDLSGEKPLNRKGDRPSAGLGVGGDTKSSTKKQSSTDSIPEDEHTKGYLDFLGESPENRRKRKEDALKSPLAPGLTPGR